MAEAARAHPIDDEPMLRKATRLDVPKMLDLVRLALGEGSIPRTEAFWRWKHEQSPFGRSPIMLMEAADGQIVSLRVFLRWRWRYGDRKFMAVRPVDTATHPNWRRRGFFERLTRELIDMMRAEGVAFVYNTPNPHSGQGYQKLGWRLVGRPTIWIRPLKPLGMIRGFLQRGQHADGGVPKANQAPAISVVDSPDLEGFLNKRVFPTNRLVTDVDAAYLQWRYRDCPGLNYGADGDFDQQSGALFIYRKTTRFGMSEFRISDLLVTGDKASKSKARTIIRARLRDCNADFASARAIAGTAEAAVLRHCGFLPAPRIGPIVAYRPLFDEADLPAIDRLSTWGAAIGDLEVF